ncbi:hypothetical protein GO755_33665 [Spirosoma sp. HMF4905]|uniref:Uncharacterized protein n=1 Tax=Spirosoma arboris TaxID=2682092 RepID=A0A7K1SMX3_9BACT|nr:hypothetical protein [Spirosoma arboris]MVM35023.1 hypothetical protein [Spirosoma arboris]
MEYNFGEKVEQLLIDKGKTKKSLYDYLKMTANGLDAMIKNNSISAVRLGQIANYFEVPVHYFYGDIQASSKKIANESSLEREEILKISDDIGQLRNFFEEEIRVKNQQIAGLQRTVDVLVGKSKGVSKKSRIAPREVSNHPSTNLMKKEINPALA